MKLVAADGVVLSHSIGSPISGGTFSVSSIPSIKALSETKGVHKDPLTYTFSGGNSSGFDPGTVTSIGPQTISSSALKALAEGSKIMLNGDSGTMLCTGTVGGTPTPVSGGVEITDPKQIKWFAN